MMTSAKAFKANPNLCITSSAFIIYISHDWWHLRERPIYLHISTYIYPPTSIIYIYQSTYYTYPRLEEPNYEFLDEKIDPKYLKFIRTNFWRRARWFWLKFRRSFLFSPSSSSRSAPTRRRPRRPILETVTTSRFRQMAATKCSTSSHLCRKWMMPFRDDKCYKTFLL